MRRILAPLVVSLLPPAVAMGAGESVLLIYDTTAEETADLADALVDAGMTVTYSHTSESAYDGTNPAPDVYDCVIHLNGTTYDVAYEMPASGQSTLVAYVEAGGCYIGTEWSAFEITKGRMTAMQDLILLDRTGYRDSSITLVDASGYSGHPVLAHVPSPFTYSGAIGTGTAMSFTPDPVEVLMEDSLGNPAVMVREHERGKVVFFHHSGNYMAWDTLADTNIQQLFVGAVEWGRREVSVLLIWDEQAAHFDDLYGALVGAGLAVTLSDTTESGYDGSNPNPDDYDVVVFMDGNPPAYQYDTPTSGQEALTDFVDAGGGFIHGAFATYEEAAYGHLVDMSDLLLINYSTLGYGFPTWTEEAAHSEHPILANVPSSFTLPKCHHAYGAAKTFGVDPVDTLMTHGSNLAVGTREFGDGRVVVLNQGENYYSVSGDDYDVLADPNVQQLYVDAAYWASGRCDADGDGALAEWCGGVDCDDQDAAYNPWADEYCDSEDTDCDGESWDDESVDAPTWYHDGDEDGYGDPDDWLVACSGPSGYVANDEDCDDERYESRPGATEYCNGHDDDCDDETDEDDAADATTWYLDGDGDGYGDPAVWDVDCYAPTDFVDNDDDCDDGRFETNPGALEYCNGHNDDCDAWTDEDDAEDATTWYLDDDDDGYGDPAAWDVECYAPTDFVDNDDDCDDGRFETNPSALEYCNDIDDDCDDETDEDDAVDATTWYLDDDEDGYGDPDVTTVACDQPDGYEDDDDDCDDGRFETNPGALEYCNDIDDDCDDETDEDDAVDVVTWYHDGDSDSFGDPDDSEVACDRPAGHRRNSDDCDDTASSVYPGADEYCNSVDDDCDEETDEDHALDATTWYLDDDEDGYGDPAVTDVECTVPDGYVANDEDCDDSTSAISPDAIEQCDDEDVDEDCDDLADDDDSYASGKLRYYIDIDDDGYGSELDSGTLYCDPPMLVVDNDEDCDDTSDSVYPGADEIAYDSIDQDCDGEDWCDSDGDDHNAEVCGGGDCDDEDEHIHPDASEIWYDGEDRDCDDASDWDADGDGHDCDEEHVSCTGDDCDDTDPFTYPGAWERPDGVDNDCNGYTEVDDDDEDGLTSEDELIAGTDPHDPDMDDDGVPDGDEVGPDLEDLVDTDDDETPDVYDDDDDGDGVATATEIGDYDWTVEGTAPPDTDGDEVPDHLDDDDDGDGIPTAEEGTGDTDGDEVPDYLDTDSDGDGASDGAEGTGDRDGDSIPDHLDDGADLEDAPQPVLDPDYGFGCGCGTAGGLAPMVPVVVVLLPLVRRRRH